MPRKPCSLFMSFEKVNLGVIWFEKTGLPYIVSILGVYLFSIYTLEFFVYT